MENPPSTVPIDILLTSDRPDIVFISKDKEITIIELTVPFNSPDCINAAHEYKVSKYQLLLSDLEAKSYTSRLVVVEIGALGHYLSRTCKSLNRAFPSIPRAGIRNLVDEVGKTAITASQRIFMARSEEIWAPHNHSHDLDLYLFICIYIYMYIYFSFEL